MEGIKVSFPTIQNILNNDIGSRYERSLKLEEKSLREEIVLTPPQTARIEKVNPCFRKSHIERIQPDGGSTIEDTFYIEILKWGHVYLHAVVDSYGNHTFGFLHNSETTRSSGGPQGSPVFLPGKRL